MNTIPIADLVKWLSQYPGDYEVIMPEYGFQVSKPATDTVATATTGQRPH